MEQAATQASAAPAQTAQPGQGGEAPSKTAKAKSGGVKDTVESIIVAFILAFIFRAFVVEAFVIPTGSMAPTLMGAHMRFRCEDCGYEWQVNYPSPDREDISIPSSAGPVAISRPGPAGSRILDHYEDYVFSIRCPNCGYKVQRFNPEDPENVATNPPVFYGDRILVLKYLYLFQEPRRWDVVVFKSPVEPQQYDYQQNYIKRL